MVLKSFQLHTLFEVLHLLHWAADMQSVDSLPNEQTEVQCNQYCIHAAGREQAVEQKLCLDRNLIRAQVRTVVLETTVVA